METPMEESTMVLKEVTPQLKDLAQLAEELNKATDSFTRELKNIEAQLAEMNLGITVDTPKPLTLSNDEEEEDENGRMVQYCYKTQLAYGRLGDQWGFIVRTYKGTYNSQRNDYDYDWVLQYNTPLLQSSRDVRIAAAAEIPEFIEKIKQEVQKKIATLHTVSSR